MPDLIIIAGPNGAGKSTTSKDFLVDHKIEAFDFDKEFYHAWSEFDFDPALGQNIQDRILDLYAEQKKLAIKNGHHFAFETNYHTSDVLLTLKMFKEAGYNTIINFILLESVDLAIERVKLRVAKGGHNVDQKTISDRFTQGLQLFDESFDLYDYVNIYHSRPNDFDEVGWMEPTKKNVFIEVQKIPLAIHRNLQNLIKFIDSNG